MPGKPANARREAGNCPAVQIPRSDMVILMQPVEIPAYKMHKITVVLDYF